MADSESNMKWTLQGEDIVIIFQHILKGESIVPVVKVEKLPDGSNNEYQDVAWAKTGEQLLSDKGIQQVSSEIYSVLNRNTYLSNLSEVRAMRLSRIILLSVNKKLFVDAEKMGLTAENYEQIIAQLIALIIPALLRPYDEGERKFQAKTSTEYRQLNQGQGQQAGQGLFGGAR